MPRDILAPPQESGFRMRMFLREWRPPARVLGVAVCAAVALATCLEVRAEAGQAPVYTVTYDPNGATGGTAPVDARTFAAGDTVRPLFNIGRLEKAGTTQMLYWNTSPDGTGLRYMAGPLPPGRPLPLFDFTMPATNVTLYAQWGSPKRFVSNGATGGILPPDDPAVPNGERVVIPVCSVTKPGFVLAGWNTAADGSGTNFPADGTGSFLMPATGVTLYAVWAPAVPSMAGWMLAVMLLGLLSMGVVRMRTRTRREA